MFPGTMRRVPRRNHDFDQEHICHCSLDMEKLIQCENDHHIPESAMLASCQLHEVLTALPSKYQNSPWHLVFSSDSDGHSLSHMYRELEAYEGQAGIAFFVVQEKTPSVTRFIGETHTTPTVGVIGAFVSELPTLRHGQHNFFGTKECFVFTFRGDKRHQSGIEVYPWSGENEDFIACSSKFVGIGGGEHGAAIFIDSDLQYASSSDMCQTFASPPLHGTPYKGLHHSELIVRQTLWFALKDTEFVPSFSKVLSEATFKEVSIGERCAFDCKGCPDHHRCSFINDYLAAKHPFRRSRNNSLVEQNQ